MTSIAGASNSNYFTLLQQLLLDAPAIEVMMAQRIVARCH